MTLGLTTGHVALHSNHAAWADEFRREKARIVDAIGPHVLDIQHVGSTSIPGVPAKPILDLLVGVEDYDEARVCIRPLERLGYLYKGEYGFPRRHYFVLGDPRTHHLHMVERTSDMWRGMILFRDFLKSDPESAREYAEAKIELAARYPKDRASYQQEKDKVVERILERAGSLGAE